MKTLGIAIAGTAALFALTACGPLDLVTSGGAGGNDFCKAFADNLVVNVDNIPILVSDGDAAAKNAAEQKIQASEDAVVALAPASIKSDIQVMMTDARAGRSEAGAPGGVDSSGPSERVAQYVTTHCLSEGIERLKQLGENGDLSGLDGLLPSNG